MLRAAIHITAPSETGRGSCSRTVAIQAITFMAPVLDRLPAFALAAGGPRAAIMLEPSRGEAPWGASVGPSCGSASQDHMLRIMFWMSAGTGAARAITHFQRAVLGLLITAWHQLNIQCTKPPSELDGRALCARCCQTIAGLCLLAADLRRCYRWRSSQASRPAWPGSRLPDLAARHHSQSPAPALMSQYFKHLSSGPSIGTWQPCYCALQRSFGTSQICRLRSCRACSLVQQQEIHANASTSHDGGNRLCRYLHELLVGALGDLLSFPDRRQPGGAPLTHVGGLPPQQLWSIQRKGNHSGGFHCSACIRATQDIRLNLLTYSPVNSNSIPAACGSDSCRGHSLDPCSDDGAAPAAACKEPTSGKLGALPYPARGGKRA